MQSEGSQSWETTNIDSVYKISRKIKSRDKISDCFRDVEVLDRELTINEYGAAYMRDEDVLKLDCECVL